MNQKLRNKILLSFLLFLVFLLIGNAEASIYKLRVSVATANIRLKPSLESTVISRAPHGAILNAEEKIGEWYKIKLPPDEQGIVLTGYIHQSIVEVLEETKEEIKREEKSKEVTPKPIPEPVVKEERPIKAKPQYIPKRAQRRNLAFSFYSSYGIVSMSDVNKIFNEINRWTKLYYPEETDELENLCGGLDFFFEGRFFIFPEIALGLEVGRIVRDSDLILVTEHGRMDLKSSGFPLTLNGYLYPLPENEISPYIRGGIGMLFYSEKLRAVENGDKYEGKYSGTGLVFRLAGGAEYFFLSSLSIGGEIGYKIAKVRTIKVKESNFYGQKKGEILLWDPSEAEGGWMAESKADLEYYERLGYEKRSGDFSGLSIKLKLSFYF